MNNSSWKEILCKAPYIEMFPRIIEHSEFVATQVEALCCELNVHPAVSERAVGLAWFHDIGKAKWLWQQQSDIDVLYSEIEIGLQYLRGITSKRLPARFSEIINLMPYLDAQVLTSCQFVSLPFEPKVTFWVDLHAQETQHVPWSERQTYLFERYFNDTEREAEFPEFIAVREKFMDSFMTMQAELSLSPPTHSKALRLARTVGGWLYEGEPEWLYELTQRTNGIDSPACEVGSWRGRSTVCIAGAIEEGESNRTLYCIDDWYGGTDPDCLRLASQMNIHGEFCDNTSNYAHRIHIIRSLAKNITDLLPNNFSLVFLDGDHSAEAVDWEVNFFSTRIVSGGILAFHDTDNPVYPAIRSAVDRLLANGEWKYVGQVKHLCALERK